MLNRVNPYDKCPVYESRNFLLRLVEENDAEDLIDCYSDPISAKLFNSDNCTSNFIYKTIDEVEDCIKFWLNEYKDQLYVRFSIVDKSIEKSIGTMEFFAKEEEYKDFGKIGVLRIDLSSKYEKENVIAEILSEVEKYFYDDFQVNSIITKGTPEAKQRVNILNKFGFNELKKGLIVMFDFYYIKKRAL